jgi:hypothetical protein
LFGYDEEEIPLKKKKKKEGGRIIIISTNFEITRKQGLIVE